MSDGPRKFDLLVATSAYTYDQQGHHLEPIKVAAWGHDEADAVVRVNAALTRLIQRELDAEPDAEPVEYRDWSRCRWCGCLAVSHMGEEGGRRCLSCDCCKELK